jgi:ankyrin repeat protein
LHIASAEGDETLVKYFYGVRASAAITDHLDRTPMHLAAENGHASIIELLADKFKASIFERTKDGSTLMHIASLNGHSECATMLFKKGVYLHMPNKKGARSIHTAAKYGHVGIISTLLQRGEKVGIVAKSPSKSPAKSPAKSPTKSPAKSSLYLPITFARTSCLSSTG